MLLLDVHTDTKFKKKTKHKRDQTIKDQRKIHLKDSNGIKYIFDIGNNGSKSIF